MSADIASEGDGMVEAKPLGGVGDFLGRFHDSINLLLGVAAGFRSEDIEPLDRGGLDIEIAVFFIDFDDAVLKFVKSSLDGW